MTYHREEHIICDDCGEDFEDNMIEYETHDCVFKEELGLEDSIPVTNNPDVESAHNSYFGVQPKEKELNPMDNPDNHVGVHACDGRCLKEDRSKIDSMRKGHVKWSDEEKNDVLDKKKP